MLEEARERLVEGGRLLDARQVTGVLDHSQLRTGDRGMHRFAQLRRRQDVAVADGD